MTTTFQDLTDDNWTELWDQLISEALDKFDLDISSELPEGIEGNQRLVDFYNYLLTNIGGDLPRSVRKKTIKDEQKRLREYWYLQMIEFNTKLLKLLYLENAELKEKLSTQD